MRCESCGKKIKNLEEEKDQFYLQLEDIYDDPRWSVDWDFENTCWQCAYNAYMEEYYELHPESRHQNYNDDDERREDPSDNYWPDD